MNSNIHISRGEKLIGIFPEEDIQQLLSSKTVLLNDLYWRKGNLNWLPLSNAFPRSSPLPHVSDFCAQAAADPPRVSGPRRHSYDQFRAQASDMSIFSLALSPSLKVASIGGLVGIVSVSRNSTPMPYGDRIVLYFIFAASLSAIFFLVTYIISLLIYASKK